MAPLFITLRPLRLVIAEALVALAAALIAAAYEIQTTVQPKNMVVQFSSSAPEQPARSADVCAFDSISYSRRNQKTRSSFKY